MVLGKVRGASLLTDGIALGRGDTHIGKIQWVRKDFLENVVAAVDAASQVLTRNWQQNRGKRGPK